MSLRYELLRLLSLFNMFIIPPVLGWLTWFILGRIGWGEDDVRIFLGLFVGLFVSVICVIGGLLSYQLHEILKALKK